VSEAWSAVKVALGAAFVLTLGTWIFFYQAVPAAPPLGPPGTTVVFGAWFVAAYGACRLWRRVAKGRQTPGKGG